MGQGANWRAISWSGGGSDDEDDDEMFEGQGHRLGGKEVPPKLGDLQLGEIRMHDAGMCSLFLSLSPSLYKFLNVCG